jgi:hypothetical protein
VNRYPNPEVCVSKWRAVIAILLGSKVKSEPETPVRMSLSLNSGRMLVSGSSRVMRPLSTHWSNAILVMSFVALPSLRTASEWRGKASAEREE